MVRENRTLKSLFIDIFILIHFCFCLFYMCVYKNHVFLYLTCTYIYNIGMMARSGVDYLKTILPPTNDVPGYAKLRILDSYTLTTGPNACNFTNHGDGRHFYPLDYIKLRVIAEGVIDALGTIDDDDDDDDANDEEDGDIKLKETITANSITPQEATTLEYKFLVDENRVKELSKTRLVGNDFQNVIEKAFNYRHVMLAGDSTTSCLHHDLVAYLLAIYSNKTMDMIIQKKLKIGNSKENKGGLRSEQILEILKEGCPYGMERSKPPYYKSRCAYVESTFCQSSMYISTPSPTLSSLLNEA